MFKKGWYVLLIAFCAAMLQAGDEGYEDPLLASPWRIDGANAPHFVKAKVPAPLLSTDPHPVHYPAQLYLGLKKIPLQAATTFDPERYLSLKQILDPMPQAYAKTYLKMKTLLNPAKKYLIVHIDKRRQEMRVYLDNDYLGGWHVSTARRGYWTPDGVFRPYSLERMHYSRKYHHSPMPWSVFFKGGFAIHGTYAIRHLGHPASHGCVRVHPDNAKKLYHLIRRYGKENTRIIIRG
ncbi:L,D-transpeptidase [Nitratifractor salsuginis]|uniref:ErfK/YbiS/YcfS/YnhG family protein n=1 Tax=Nitratifractor salsuginis (strain DSM 16511 / JCM 12458 / E9I37-1) TaxID=749222 RepID=E6X144_NITSE|nr:L,D-transpeptidase [Nitratifractor salsuginis]ADV45847.1 ErfK/YbiS/YcfS/YnhG family protein [Nitratifractor salsuginis DSM 16511]